MSEKNARFWRWLFSDFHTSLIIVFLHLIAAFVASFILNIEGASITIKFLMLLQIVLILSIFWFRTVSRYKNNV